MASPDGYFDDTRCDLDPPPRGWPRPMGASLDRLASFRKAADLRSPADQPDFERNVAIVILLRAGMRQRVVARMMGISQPRVANILREMEVLVVSGVEDE